MLEALEHWKAIHDYHDRQAQRAMIRFRHLRERYQQIYGDDLFNGDC